jgi:adenylylsulfate kinase
MLNNCCLWLTGLSGAGKTTIAERLVEKLEGMGHPQCNVEHLDGDIVRQTFCKDLGFTKADRDENIKRISYVAAYLSASRITVCTFISPYREARAKARHLCNNFIEVHVDCPLETCEDRDVKGLYARARAGEIKGFTGIDDPYEAPESPEISLQTDKMTLDECVDKILKYLYEH